MIYRQAIGLNLKLGFRVSNTNLSGTIYRWVSKGVRDDFNPINRIDFDR